MALRTVAAPSPGCSMPACSRIQPSIFTCHMRSRSSAAQIVQRERRQAGGLLLTRVDTLLNQALEPASFGAGVIACTPSEVDAIIAHLVAQPDLYAQQVRRGQERLTSFSGAEFARWFTDFQRPRQEHAA